MEFLKVELFHQVTRSQFGLLKLLECHYIWVMEGPAWVGLVPESLVEGQQGPFFNLLFHKFI